MRYMALCSLLVFLIGCQGLQHNLTSRPYARISQHEASSSQVQLQLKEPYVSSYGEVPTDDHPAVDKWINYFQNNGREHIEKYLSRSTRYIPMMKQVLREYKLPEDLVYVAMIESGFNSRAHSTASAVGYWQFIADTGRRYGLKINSHVDERRDPVLATRAAAAYFKDLYSTFESWYLALASYNAGEYRISRANLAHYSRNFWYLIERRAFPRETANYIPKFIAAVRIGKDPEKYGFTDIIYQAPMEYDTIHLPHPISLKKLATNINIDYEQLRHLNPRYRGKYVPLEDEEGTTLRVPIGMKERATAVIAQCKMRAPKYMHSDYFSYRVRRGDNLSQIAHRYRTTVSILRRINNMSKNSILLAGSRIKVPYYNKRRSKKQLAEKHIVKRGQSINSIARTYGVKPSRLKKLNKLRGNIIHPGQVLRLVNNTSAKYSLQGGGGSIPNKKQISSHQIHIVEIGDTLIGIAKKYNVSLPDLMQTNALDLKSIIRVGRQIAIPK